MRVLCVDDAERDLRAMEALCERISEIDEVAAFSAARDALAWLEAGNTAGLALLDIGMPETDGLTLAKALRKRSANLPIIFVTGRPEYALEAYEVHPTAFLLKPVDPERLAREVNYALLTRPAHAISHICAHTFGSFELLVDGKAVSFPRAKAKELLALLIDRHGGGLTRRDAFMEMWENREYDLKMQKYFDVVLHSLRATLRKNCISEILECSAKSIRIRPELIDCDMYRFLSGDPDAMGEFRGVYMDGYVWADAMEGYIAMN